MQAHDNHAAWAWLILVIIIVVFVASFDIWAAMTHHRLMTDQFRLWLGDSVIGPFIWGGWVGVFAGLTYHWFLKKRVG